MSKYEIIKKVIESNKLNEAEKVDYIKMFLGGWYLEHEIKWIWEE